MYVGDVVRANLAAIRYHESGIFNIGTGKETTVNALYDHIKDLTNSPHPRQHLEARPGEQKRSVLGVGSAAEKLGWKPAMPLREGLAKTLAWFRTVSSEQ